jgi:hypothetical protein
MTVPGNSDPASNGRPWIITPTWKLVAGKTGLIVPVATAAVIGLGLLIGWLLVGVAQFDQACGSSAPAGTWKGIAVSGLPGTLQATFGYGRGTQLVESTLTATAQPGVKLPSAVRAFAEPLATSDGTQTIPTVVGKSVPHLQSGISAVAVRIPATSTYQLEVCVRAPSAAAGLYSSQLLFPGATLSSGASLPVSVTFQSEAVPFILTAGIVPLALLGMTYTTLFLVRRTNPDLPLTGLAKNLREEIWSVNGVYAFILSIGAVFTAWNVQCFRNPTWGTPWPTLLLTMVTMAGAAGVASTVPMGLSSK